MQNIYYDMFVADGLLTSVPDIRMQTDSLKVYASIFEKYGYTEEQFLTAQTALLAKPKQMTKVITSARTMLEKRLSALTREVEVLDSIADAAFALVQDSIAAREEFLDSLSFACILDTVCLSFSTDTVDVRILDHKADTAAKADPTQAPDSAEQSRSRHLPSRARLIKEDFSDEVVVEEDIEFKELEELEEASKRHRGVSAKERQKLRKNRRNK